MSQSILRIEQVSSFFSKSSPPPKLIVLATLNYPYVQNVQKIYTKSIQQTEQQEISFRHLHGLETTEEELYAELSTQDIFSGTKLLIIRHSEVLLQKILESKKSSYYFHEAIQHLPVSNYYIFHISKTDITKKIQKFFSSPSTLYIAEQKIFDHQVSNILLNMVLEEGYQTDLATMQLLAQKVHYQLHLAISILSNLYLFTISSKNITIQDVQKVCFSLEGDTFFDIIRSLSQRKIYESIKKLHQYKSKNISLLIHSMFKLWYGVIRFQALSKSSLSLPEINKKIGLSLYYQKNIQEILKKYSKHEIEQILHFMWEFHEKVKTSKNSQEEKEHMQFLLIQIVSLKNSFN